MHGQGKILYRYANLVVGLFLVDSLNDAIPLLVACHEVILHHLFCFEVAVSPDEIPHTCSCQRKRAERHNIAARCVDPSVTDVDSECEDEDSQGCCPKQYRKYCRIAIVVNASP